jgi:hypothetical protein
MDEHPDPIICSDDTEQITVDIPCLLAQRVQKYALENGDTVGGVVIDALDFYLRRPKAG